MNSIENLFLHQCHPQKGVVYFPKTSYVEYFCQKHIHVTYIRHSDGDETCARARALTAPNT